MEDQGIITDCQQTRPQRCPWGCCRKCDSEGREGTGPCAWVSRRTSWQTDGVCGKPCFVAELLFITNLASEGERFIGGATEAAGDEGRWSAWCYSLSQITLKQSLMWLTARTLSVFQGTTEGDTLPRVHRSWLQHCGRGRRRRDFCLFHPGGRTCRSKWGAQERRPHHFGTLIIELGQISIIGVVLVCSATIGRSWPACVCKYKHSRQRGGLC